MSISRETNRKQKLDPFDVDVEAAKTKFTQSLNDLKQQLLDGEITQAEFEKEYDAKLNHLQSLKELDIQYGKDVTNIDSQILDHKIKYGRT